MSSSRSIVAAASCLFSSLSLAAPAVIDSEQEARSAWMAAQRSLTDPSYRVHFVVDTARRIAEDALAQLAGATTPTLLMSARDGLTLPCATSGTLHASLPRRFPRVLALRWNACRFFDHNGFMRQRDGVGQIILLRESFTPRTLAGIRLGSAGQDFIDYREILDTEQNSYETQSWSLRITGLLPMVRAFPRYGLFMGPYAYDVTGVFQEHRRYELPDPEVPPYEDRFLAMYEHLVASGSVTYDDSRTHSSEIDHLHAGKVTWSHMVPGWDTETSTFAVRGLRSRRDSEYVNWTGRQWLDGEIEYGWTASSSPLCFQGPLRFETKTPLSGRLFDFIHHTGDLLINSTARWQFFTADNVPAELPVPQQGMLAHLQVAGVGTFNYDVPGSYALGDGIGCF